MLSVRFTVAGEQQYARRFDALAHELQDLQEPLERVRDQLVLTVGQQFMEEGAHGTSKWQPLNASYEAWKESAYPGRPILVRTGAMRQAFLVDGTRELTATRLRWGLDDQTNEDGERIADYALAHQTGEGHVPQRKIVALRFDDKRQMDRAFVEHITYLRRSLIGGHR